MRLFPYVLSLSHTPCLRDNLLRTRLNLGFWGGTLLGHAYLSGILLDQLVSGRLSPLSDFGFVLSDLTLFDRC